jgi:hypothetical protein
MILPGLIDIHVHTAPDVRPRSLDDFELAREAQRVGARAVVLKSHHMLTADRALLARQAVPGAEVFGGVTLNPSVGGLNVDAVDVALRLGGRFVWLPTLFARRHRQLEGKGGGIVVVENDAVVPAAREIFQRVAAADAILATGHHSADEVRIIVAEAWTAGVRRIVINHPEHRTVDMSIEQQRALRSEYPVFFERCFAQPSHQPGEYDSNFETNLRAIEALGAEATILATDAGQIENPAWAKCWEHIFEFYSRRGIGEAELRRMTMANPAALLGL